MRRAANANYRRIINSAAWRRLRDTYYRAHPLCEACLADGRAVPAEDVHHVVPIERARTFGEMERLALSAGNLRSLCRNCHEAEHRRLASKSVDNAQECSRAASERFARKFFEK